MTIKMARTKKHSAARRISLVLSAALMSVITSVASAATLKDISYASLPGNRLEVRLAFDGTPPEVKGYSIEKPARIALDFGKTVNATGSTTRELNLGDLRSINGAFEITGAGGAIPFQPFTVEHGNIDALGFRIGGLAYLPDVSAIPDPAWAHLDNLDIWVLDALRRAPHPTHAHLAQALEWIERAAPKEGVLTNMHIDLDHDAVMAETPKHIRPAYDGMVLELAF